MNAVLQAYALCVLVLLVKMLALSCYQGYWRIRHLAFANWEDAAFFARPALNQELPQVQRAARAWLNDLENIPLFFALGGLALALQVNAAASIALFYAFTAARVVHSLMYLGSWQPWRTLAYVLALACLLALAVLVGLRLL